MGKRCRFVQPDQVRLYLVDVHKRALQKLIDEKAPPDAIADAEAMVEQSAADGDWVDVKAELNAGETRRIFTDIVKELNEGEKAVLDPNQVGLTKMAQYIVAWSFVNAEGRSEPFTVAALNHLETDSFREVSAAIDWHDEQVGIRRDERKNARTSGSTSPVISESVAG
jgi:hypothetical protein